MTQNAIIAEAHVSIDKPLQWVFEQVVPIDLTTIFRGHWPLPAVVAVREQSGAWDQADQTRTVVLADGATARERLLVVTPPSYFSYRIGEFTGVLGMLADYAHGQWWFESDGSGERTSIRWRYEFFARSGWASLILKAIVALAWKAYMAEALALTKSILEIGSDQT